MALKKTLLVGGLGFIGTILASAGGSRAAISYNVIDLGVISPGDASDAHAISATGSRTIVGESDSTSNAAFIYKNSGPMTSLGTLGGSNSVAYAINSTGLVVGGSDLSNGHQHAFSENTALVSPTQTDLGTLGGLTSVAYGVNGAGLIVGEADPSSGAGRAFYYNGTMHAIVHDNTGSNVNFETRALGVNNAGTIVGFDSTFSAGGQEAFLDVSGTEYAITAAGDSAQANAINTNGLIVGQWTTTGGSPASLGFLYNGTNGTNGTFTSLTTLSGGTYSDAVAVNNSGLVVGNADTTSSSSDAFLYNGATMQDLNDLINPASGWQLTNAEAINSAGDIAGVGIVGGEQHAFLLTAVPEPGSVSAIVLGACCLLLHRRRPVRD